MAISTIECPECQKTLKLAAPLAPGKKIRCPKCQAVFTVPDEDERPVSAIRSKGAKVPVKKRPDDEEDEGEEEKPRARRNGIAAGMPARKRPVHDEDEPAEEVERPRKKKKKEKEGSGMLLWICGGVAVLLLGGFALTAFVWPGFLRSSDKGVVPIAQKGGPKGGGPGGGEGAVELLVGTGKENLLAYVPAQSTLVLGGNFAAVRDNPDQAKWFDLGSSLTLKNDSPDVPGLLPMIANADKVVVAVNVDQQVAVIAILTRQPYELEKTKQAFKANAAETTSSGKPIYALGDMGPAGKMPPGGQFPPGGQMPPSRPPNYLAMPNNRVLLFATAKARTELDAIVDSDGNTPRIGGDLLTQVRNVESNLGWVVGTISGKLKEEIGKIKAEELGLLNFLAPAIAPLQNAKLASATVGFSGKNMKFSLSVTCANDADAIALKNAVGQVKQAPTLVSLLPIPKEAAKIVTSLTQDVSKNFQVQNQGPLATASLEISEATLQEAKGLATLLTPSVQKVREAAARTVSVNNLKQMVLAMHAHHGASKALPAAAICDQAGKPLLSWRVAILPYVEQGQLYQQFKLNEPWDSEHNKKLIPMMPAIYVVPAAPTDPKSGETHYRVFVGGGAGFEWTKGIRFAEIRDGTSNTVAIVEAAQSVPWTKPDELVFDKKAPLPKLGNFYGKDIFNAAFFDGTVRALSSNLPEAVLRAYITRDGGETISEK